MVPLDRKALHVPASLMIHDSVQASTPPVPHRAGFLRGWGLDDLAAVTSQFAGTVRITRHPVRNPNVVVRDSAGWPSP